MNPPQGANSPEQNLVNSDDSNAASFLKATPRPWTISYSPCDKTICIYDREGVEPICEMSSAFSMIETDANAALIVAAVNAYSPAEHAQLVSRVASMEGALAKADELERFANLLACAKDRDERNRYTVLLAVAQGEYREARRALLSPVPQEGQKALGNTERG